MVLGFRPQFVEPIKKGTKIHSIREDKTDRWKADRAIHMATGTRTKKYNQFDYRECVSVQKIQIWWTAANVPFVYIDGRLLNSFETLELCKNDGFKGEQDFFNWFREDYEGKIIHWTDKRY